MSSSRRILVVEDSTLQQRLSDLVLGSLGHHADSIGPAGNGGEAFAQLAQHRDVALILLDVNMPVMNGLEFLERLQREPLLRHIPVVICSSEDREEDIRRGLELGARAYLIKPFRTEHLVELVTRVLGGATRAPLPASPAAHGGATARGRARG